MNTATAPARARGALLFGAALVSAWLPGGCVPSSGRDDDDPSDDDGADDDATPPGPGAFQVHFFDIGTGDATLVVAPTGESLLVDLGVPQVLIGSERASAEAVVERIEEILGAPRVDAFVATHYHTDHLGRFDQGDPTGGLPYAAEVLGLEVGTFFDRGSSPLSDSDTQAHWLGWLAGREHRVIDAAGDDWFDLGPDVTVDVLAPAGAGALEGEPGAIEENNFSLPLRVTFGDLEIALCGDLPGSFTERDGDLEYQDVETAVAEAMGAVEVLKPNHHGSQSSSNLAWLNTLKARHAVLTLGPNNVGYPHEYTWDRLVEAARALDGRVWLTRDGAAQEVDGEIVVRSEDGRAYTIAGEPYESASDAEEEGIDPPLPGFGDESDDAACSNGRDDDGDCYCDCDDWSCSLNPSVSVCHGGSSSWCGYDPGPWCDGDLADRD